MKNLNKLCKNKQILLHNFSTLKLDLDAAHILNIIYEMPFPNWKVTYMKFKLENEY